MIRWPDSRSIADENTLPADPRGAQETASAHPSSILASEHVPDPHDMRKEWKRLSTTMVAVDALPFARHTHMSVRTRHIGIESRPCVVDGYGVEPCPLAVLR